MAIINAAKLVVHGDLPGGEIWSAGMGAALGVDIASGADAQDAVDAVAASSDFGQLLSVLGTIMASSSRVLGLTGYFYDVYPGPSAHQAEHVLNQAGAGPQVHPNQVSLVGTTLTGQAGRSNRGRIYLPATGIDIEGNGQTINAVLVAAAAGVAGFARSIEAIGDGCNAAVLSIKKGSAPPIVSVRVDSRLDIQRRRANSQSAAFTATAAV